MNFKKINHSLLSTKQEDPPPDLLKKSYIISLKSHNSTSEWKQILRKSIYSPKEIANYFNLLEEDIKQICNKYPARVNPYYLSLIKEKGDAVYKQCIPSIEEIKDAFGEEDPLHEEPENQSKKDVPPLLTHRYPDRVLFQISNQCAMYCRFCTRKRKTGDLTKQPKWSEICEGLNYIKSHLEIRDVILSGGDPLILDDNYLEKIIKAVYNIINKRKNGIIRIGTRIPCSLPQRITPELCNMLKKYHPIYINTHFNHPSEITDESRKACNMLADTGIPLGCQTVLLKGVNDNAEIMKELMQGLLSMRIKPYYIYQADPVKGTNHFRTRVEKGLEIYSKLRGYISGLCVPTFVIDAPGGGGKIPILPEYIIKKGDNLIFRNYEGKIYQYPQVKEN